MKTVSNIIPVHALPKNLTRTQCIFFDQKLETGERMSPDLNNCVELVNSRQRDKPLHIHPVCL